MAYSIVTSIPGWPSFRPAPAGSRRTRFLVVVPAHDEELVIAGVLGDLAMQTYPTALIRTVVAADRCTDRTATVAAGFDAVEVIERTRGPAGKGPALADAVDASEGWDAVVVLDADNRVPADMLERFDDELCAGHDVLQAYLDVVDPDGGVLQLASALTYWAGNRAVQLARSRLRWSADLGGTGMCLRQEALADAGGFGGSLTEDQELGIRLVMTGRRVHWVHDVRVRDEKPADVGVAVRQRARWVAGKRQLAKRHAAGLLRSARHQRSWAPVDVLLRLVQPGRSFLALVVGALFAVALVLDTTWLLPASVLGIAAVAQFVWPIPFLMRENLQMRYLLSYPLIAVIALLWLPIQVASSRQGGWYHTPHGAQARSRSRRQGKQ